MNEEKYIELEKKVFEDFTRKHPKSKQLFEKAAKTAPGGVAGAGGAMRPFPIYFTHGMGNRLYDIDEIEYIDGQLGSGVNLLGHCYPEIQEAIKREMDRGLWLPNPVFVDECNELLAECIPCAEAARYRNTGTEVCSAATMAARAYTGKNKIIKFYGAYHGVDPEFLVGWGAHTTELVSAGVPKEMLANTVLLMPDVDEVRKKLDEDNDIAGVITDVIQGVGGILPFSRAELMELRKLTKERGVILIFDEVLTGFRLALGGSQEYFGVTPDIAVVAKATGGGEKFAAIVGSKELLTVFNPPVTKGSMFGGGAKAVFQSGTMNNGTTGVAGAIACMKALKKKREEGEYDKLNQRMARYAAGIEDAFRTNGIGCHVNYVGSYYKIHLTDEEATYDVICKADQRLRYLFTVALMNENLLICMPASGSCFINFAFTDEDIDKMLTAFNTTLDKYNWTDVYHS